MRYLFIGSALAAVVAFVALTFWRPPLKPLALQQSPVVAAVRQPAAVPQPAAARQPAAVLEPAVSMAESIPDSPQSPAHVELPSSSATIPAEPAEQMPARRRVRHPDSREAAQVDRSVANGLTGQLNRAELQTLQRGGGMGPGEGSPRWRVLQPPR
jgi:hypothetical protein